MAVLKEVQYVSDADGNNVGVLVPIELWREIASERETAYLLQSETMRRRLLEAKTVPAAHPLRKPVKSLVFDSHAFEDLQWWVERDRKTALRIFKLIQEIQRTPFEGTGQPEPLKYELAGCWSRRIDQEHRLVYQVNEDGGTIRILACRYHY